MQRLARFQSCMTGNQRRLFLESAGEEAVRSCPGEAGGRWGLFFLESKGSSPEGRSLSLQGS